LGFEGRARELQGSSIRQLIFDSPPLTCTHAALTSLRMGAGKSGVALVNEKRTRRRFLSSGRQDFLEAEFSSRTFVNLEPHALCPIQIRCKSVANSLILTQHCSQRSSFCYPTASPHVTFSIIPTAASL